MAKKKSIQEHFEDVRGVAYGGALAVKSTDVLRHAQDHTALMGDVSGFVGIGVAGAMSEAAAGALRFGKKRKRKRKRR